LFDDNHLTQVIHGHRVLFALAARKLFMEAKGSKGRVVAVWLLLAFGIWQCMSVRSPEICIINK